jgi:predicted transcriptional regulator
MADTRVITAHVPAEMAEQVDKYAEQMDRSRGWIVKQALADWLSWEEEKNRLTLEAIEDVKEGRVVSDDAMRKWIESLDTESPLPPPHLR